MTSNRMAVSSIYTGIRLLARERRDAAANVAGKRLHFLQRRQFHFAILGQTREGLQIQFCVSRNYGETHARSVTFDHESLKYLLQRKPDLRGNCLGAEVLRIDLVFAQLKVNSRILKKPNCIGFHVQNCNGILGAAGTSNVAEGIIKCYGKLDS